MVTSVFVILAGVLLFIVCRPRATAVPSGATYIPEKRCYVCHKPLSEKHARTSHARSFETLIDSGEEKNPKCLPCHTTGYGLPGGFVDVKSTPDLVGVGCQSCHGRGSAHVELGLSKEQRLQNIQRDPKDACTKCHKIHEEHADIGAKSLPYLKKKIERIQQQIKKLGG